MTDHCSMYSKKVHPKPSVSAHPVSCTWQTSMYVKKVHPKPNVSTHPECCTWQTSMYSKKVHPKPNVSTHPVGFDPRSLLPWLWLCAVYSAILLACYGVICNLIQSLQIRRGGWRGFCVEDLKPPSALPVNCATLPICRSQLSPCTILANWEQLIMTSVLFCSLWIRQNRTRQDKG